MEKINKDINRLRSPFKEKVKAFLIDCYIQWLQVFVTEWLRTPMRQKELYAQGRTKPWKIVTWTMDSLHLSWNAIDIAYREKELYPTDSVWWKTVFNTAKRYWIGNLWEDAKLEKAHLQNKEYPISDLIREVSNVWKQAKTNEQKLELHEVNNVLRMI